MSANTSDFPLTSFAVNPKTQPPYLVWNRTPTTTDYENPGTRVQDNSTTPPTLWETTGGGNWFNVTPGTGILNTLTGNSGGAIAPVAGNINVVGASGTLVAGSGNTLTITAAPQSFTWNNDPASGALLVNNGYIIKTGAKSFSLPAASAIGDEVALMLTGGTSWTITQGAGQSIIVGASTSTVGVGGSIATTGAGQTIWIICTTANTTWEALAFVGALNVV